MFRREKLLSQESIPRGISELNGSIGGDFPKGSLILLAGNPGTGKTSFAAQFMCDGANKAGEKGVYVSFAEGREQFRENMARHFGQDCRRCLTTRRCRFLDFTTVKSEGISLILEEILRAVRDSKAKLLVIDSFSAMTQALEEKIETRTIIHTVLGKIVRKMGCTTILIVEIPTGMDSIGEGIEEFVADGVIVLRKGEVDGYLIRDLEIAKMRDRRLLQQKYIISLEGGFKIILPFASKTMNKKGRFEPVQNSEDQFSTGNRHLDDLLGGGYRKGSVILLELDGKVSFEQVALLLLPTIANFLSQDRGVMLVPPASHDSEYIAQMLIDGYGISGEKLGNLFRGLQFATGAAAPRYVVNLLDQGEAKAFETWISNESELVKKSGKPVLHVVSLEAFEAVYGSRRVIRRMMMFSTGVKANRGLSILVCRPGLKRVKQRAINLADIHFKIIREHGALLIFGKKGIRTPILGTEEDPAADYPIATFTPIT